VLFLDELPEFSRRALESLREPLEEGSIHIARASMSLCFPACVLLVAAMNPCPCGRFSDKQNAKPCLCAFEQIQRYRSRISGPLLDRIDLHVLVDAVPYRDFAQRGSGETSQAIRNRVQKARDKQWHRLGLGRTNSMLKQKELQQYVSISSSTGALIEAAIEKNGLSTRGVNRVLKVARTIADLEDATEVDAQHVQEAIEFRTLDREALGSNR
jgi:magnesium chelatase family protein